MFNLKEEIDKIDLRNIVKISVNAGKKYTAVPALLKGKEVFLFETIIDKKAFHENVPAQNLSEHLSVLAVLNSNFVIFTKTITYEFKITKKGALLKNSSINNLSGKIAQESFFLPLEIPALFDLGVVGKDGFLVKGMNDKFKQIEKFTEIVYDEIKNYKTNGAKIKIIDSGCGKAYLSFVLYHYLKIIKNIDIQITGIDLKADVVENLNKTAVKYGYDGMVFINKDIFKAEDIFKNADVLISLHACDKATDYTLFNAVQNGVKIILAAPCCQHEFNETFSSRNLKILNRYGIIKERLSALCTDAVRASLLVSCGYKTIVAEFVPLAHSPKNLMIKAVKANLSENVRKEAKEEAEVLLNEFSAENAFYSLLYNDKI